MALPPLSWIERFEARFPRAWRGLITLAVMIIVMTVISNVAYPPADRWSPSDFAQSRYDVAWDLMYCAWAITPVWLAWRHPAGWWKALLPGLLVVAVGTMKLIGRMNLFFPTDVGGVGAMAGCAINFGVFAVASIPATALAAFAVRRISARMQAS